MRGKGRLKQILGAERWSKKIFVLGTGRSGTHWLGYVIGAHDSVFATVEKAPIFQWATELAIRPYHDPRLYHKLVRQYRREHASVAPLHYLDKSHPNLWHADVLAESFPEASFVAIRRDVYGTVASMLKHEGVLRWIYEWKDYPIPNHFLGIRADTVEAYDALTVEAKCAVRWKAHDQRIKELCDVLSERLLCVRYEDLQTRTDEQLERIRGFLGLEGKIPTPIIRNESLERWRDELSDRQIGSIDEVIKDFPV